MEAKDMEVVEKYQFWRSIIEEDEQRRENDSLECGSCGCGEGCQGSCCE